MKTLHRVEVKTKSKTYAGVVLERPELADKNHIVLKLDSGYNIGIDKKKILSMKDLGKVDTDNYMMTPGSGGTWRSLTWTATSTVTVCKMDWRATPGFDHDIKVSADNGANWTTVSSGGSMTNMDQEVVIPNSGTQIIVEVSGGTQGSLLDYTILTK